MTTHIPCEYCDELISIHNWEWHSVCNNDIFLMTNLDFCGLYYRGNVLILKIYKSKNFNCKIC
jgi:hypothetical protein